MLYTISTDFPFAQKRWCAAAGVDKIKLVSDVIYAEFGEKYGVLIKERRYFRRAVFIVGRDRQIDLCEVYARARTATRLR